MKHVSGSVGIRGLLWFLIVSMGVPAYGASQVPSLAIGIQGVGGPYFQTIEKGLYYPAYLERDSAVIARELGLGEEERILVDTLIDSYVRQFEAEAAQVQLAIQSSNGGARGDLPDMTDRKAIRKRAKAAMRPQGDPFRLQVSEEPVEARLARVSEIIREEIDRPNEEPLPGTNRTLIISDWSSRKQELQDELLEKFDLVKGVDASHWDAVNRALRRINTAWPEVFRGEGVDLDLMLANHFGSESAQYKALWQDRLQYAMEYDELLAYRNELLASTTPPMLDARDRTDLGRAIELGTQQIKSRAALVDLNLDWLARFIEKIDNEEQAQAFASYVHASIFPDIHRGDPPLRTIQYVIENQLASSEFHESLEEVADAYQNQRSAWRAKAIKIMPTWERDRLMHEMERNIVHLAYNGWLNGLGVRRESLNDWKLHLQAGIELDTEYLAKIKQIIGGLAYQEIPGQYRTPRRGDYNRGPVRSPSGRSLNVVYWDEMMRSQ